LFASLTRSFSADFNRWNVSAEYAAEKTYRTIGVLGFTRRNLKPLPGYETTQTSDKPIGYMGAFVLRSLW
jgi:hypothetical protein